jgi:hypothetical protein
MAGEATERGGQRRRAAPAGLLLLLISVPAHAETGLPADVIRLARIKHQAVAQLSRVPDYACIETIERSYRPSARRPFVHVDTLRLEVAYVGARELYSWPGGDPFGERDLAEFSGGGLIGTGHFAGLSRSLFIDDKASIAFAAAETLHGHKTVRYDYRVPFLASNFLVRAQTAWARVAWHGRFWADAESLELLRVEAAADDLPPAFPSSEVRSVVDYSRTRLGAAEALVPAGAELVSAQFSGEENRNRIRFSNCRQYGSQSSLYFGDVPDTPAKPAPQEKTWLPGGLTFGVTLRHAIDSNTAAAGDPVLAVINTPVEKAGVVLLRKGAVVRGRIRKFQRVLYPIPAILIGLEFTDVDYQETRAYFRAELEDIGPQSGLQVQRPQMQKGVCSFRALGPSVRLRPGLPMTVHTVARAN